MALSSPAIPDFSYADYLIPTPTYLIPVRETIAEQSIKLPSN